MSMVFVGSFLLFLNFLLKSFYREKMQKQYREFLYTLCNLPTLILYWYNYRTVKETGKLTLNNTINLSTDLVYTSLLSHQRPLVWFRILSKTPYCIQLSCPQSSIVFRDLDTFEEHWLVTLQNVLQLSLSDELLMLRLRLNIFGQECRTNDICSALVQLSEEWYKMLMSYQW